MDKIIKIQQLPSGCTAIVSETSSDGAGLEIGPGALFFHSEDIPDLARLLRAADKHFLEKA